MANQPEGQGNGGSQKRGFPDWYKAVFGLVAALFVVINIAYRLGAGGISVSGADTSLNRQYDHSLYKIDDKRAFLITKSGDVSVVKYTGGMFPFAPVCGSFSLDGSILNLADYMKGPFVYSEYPEFEGVDAVNLETGETFKVDAKKPTEWGQRVDPKTVELYAKNGLTFDKELKLTPDVIASKYQGLSAINESCIVFNAAFFLIFAVLIIIGAVFGLGLLLRRSPR